MSLRLLMSLRSFLGAAEAVPSVPNQALGHALALPGLLAQLRCMFHACFVPPFAFKAAYDQRPGCAFA